MNNVANEVQKYKSKTNLVKLNKILSLVINVSFLQDNPKPEFAFHPAMSNVYISKVGQGFFIFKILL